MPTYWVPLYTMTTFSPIPYHEVTEQSKNQDLIVKWTIPTLFATFLGTFLNAEFIKNGINGSYGH